jgi:ABC-2 type transport system ATP-binding protein
MRSLSGGMKRRVMVAQALVHRPPVIVLDEPTAGVDVELRQALWSFVRSLNAAGHTIVLTTHYLEEAQQLCTRIAMMKEGRIVALDSTARLLAAFSERVLRVKLASGELPPLLAARATRDAAGAWRIPVVDPAHIEESLARLREAGAAIEGLEVAEPELEEVFVKIMGRDEPAPAFPP